jgi:hypothetical protein
MFVANVCRSEWADFVIPIEWRYRFLAREIPPDRLRTSYRWP